MIADMNDVKSVDIYGNLGACNRIFKVASDRKTVRGDFANVRFTTPNGSSCSRPVTARRRT